MKLSVLICTYNRPDLLTQCLDALVRRTTEKPDQVVVVNGGDERSDEVVRQIARGEWQGLEIKLVKTVNKSLAASRNVGLPHCTGEIIAMTDDDAEVFPDWITRLKAAHREHPEAGAIGGSVIGTNTYSVVGKVADLITFPDWDGPRYVRTLPGVNISYKREVVDGIGAQDETLFRGEDVDYNWRVQQLGYKVYFDPQIKVHHHHRPTLKGLLNQHYMYGRAYYLVRRKWQDMYCIYPRRIRRVRDVLKAANCIAGLLYEPFAAIRPVSSFKTQLGLIPIVFLTELAWKSGMAMEAWGRSENQRMFRGKS